MPRPGISAILILVAALSNHSYLTYYDQMPIPVNIKLTHFISLGELEVGIQFRELRDDIVAQNTLEKAKGDTRGKVENLDDIGVALHIFYQRKGERVEVLRFDCFDKEPHYHYINWDERRNEVAWIDPITTADALTWCLEVIANRLPSMLDYALGPNHAITIDQTLIDRQLSTIATTAHRARHDIETFQQGGSK